MEEKIADTAVSRHPLSELQPAVLPPLATRMEIDLLINEESKIWLLYSRPLQDMVKWAEYDPRSNKLALIMLSGQLQELGLVIPEKMQELLRNSRELYLVQITNKEIEDCGIVPLMVHTWH